MITGGYFMNVNFELYRIFFVVASVGNITKASKELCISQPAVTKQIKQLEDQLGGELFIRTKRGVILTDNGKEIYNYIKQAMNLFSNAEMQFSNLKKLGSGTLKIGTSTTLAKLYLIGYLNEFHKEYPNVGIQILTNPSSELKEMLKDGKLDMVIAKDFDLMDDNLLDKTKLGVLHHSFIASSKYNELKDVEVKLEDMNKYPLLMPQNPSTTRALLADYCKRNDIALTTRIEIASYSLIEELVSIGLGIGLVTEEFIKKEVMGKDIFFVKTNPPLPSINFSLFTLKDSHHSFAANKLIEMITEKKK
jgi:DNA-binding transcriptional LysR family regulator